MHRLFILLLICYIIFIGSIDGAKKKSYTTGIVDIVRKAFEKSLNRLLYRVKSYESDVFRYTQLSQYGHGGLYAGESCRLSSVICSHDDHCCSGRCICRRWTITGEERCVRKCY